MNAGRKTTPRRRTAAGAPGKKTRITIRLDDDVLGWFRRLARAGGGGGYQTLIDLALRDYIAREPLEATLRRVIREELARAAGRAPSYSYDEEGPRRALVADADDAGAEYGASLKRRRRRTRSRKE